MSTLTPTGASADGLLTTKEAVKYTGLNRQTFFRLRAAGELFPEKVIGNRLYYSIDDLDDLINVLNIRYDKAVYMTTDEASAAIGYCKSNLCKLNLNGVKRVYNGHLCILYKRDEVEEVARKVAKARVARRKKNKISNIRAWIDSKQRQELINRRGYAGTIVSGKRLRNGIVCIVYDAKIQIAGKCYAKQSKDRETLVAWLKMMTIKQENPQNLFSRNPVLINGYITMREVNRLIAASNPYAPKKYPSSALMRSVFTGFRDIRYMKRYGLIYVNKEDLEREMKEAPFYNKAVSISKRSVIRVPYHALMPEGLMSAEWVTIRQASEILGEKLIRIRRHVQRYNIRAFAYNGKLHINLNEARAVLSERTGRFLFSRGLNPDDYEYSRTILVMGITVHMYYAPDLIGK